MLADFKKIQDKVEKIQLEASDEKKLSYSALVALSVFVLLLPVLFISYSFDLNLVAGDKESQTANITNSNMDTNFPQGRIQQNDSESDKRNYKVLRIEI